MWIAKFPSKGDTNDTAAWKYLNIELAKNVGGFFQLSLSEMDPIIDQVKTSVSKWREVARMTGIPGSEQERMSSAFSV